MRIVSLSAKLSQQLRPNPAARLCYLATKLGQIQAQQGGKSDTHTSAQQRVARAPKRATERARSQPPASLPASLASPLDLGRPAKAPPGQSQLRANRLSWHIIIQLSSCHLHSFISCGRGLKVRKQAPATHSIVVAAPSRQLPPGAAAPPSQPFQGDQAVSLVTCAPVPAS